MSTGAVPCIKQTRDVWFGLTFLSGGHTEIKLFGESLGDLVILKQFGS